MLTHGRGVAWLAESAAGEALGSNVLLLFPRIPSPRSLIADEGYVASVYTRPEWRGRGVGTSLIRESIAEARRRGLARIRLHATESGRRVYTALGFAARTDEMELWL
jgi:GNAT superfamily N-acetyltransferase